MSGDGGRRRDARSVAEWVSLAISATIVAGLVGLVLYQHLARGDRPPSIDVRPQLEAVRGEAEAYYLPVEIANRGDRTAEDVRVQLVLSADQGRRQAAELRIDFLPGGGTASGTAVFQDDPARGRLAVEMLSFLEP